MCSRALALPGVWQRGYWEKVVRTYEDPADVIRYILMNPVRGGIVSDYRKYPFAGSIDLAK
jgi:hypothetical protein